MKKKLLLVQPSIQPPGGGNGVAAWMVEVLKTHYELHLLTLEPVDLKSVNRFFGTALVPGEFACLQPGRRVRAILRRLPVPGGLLKSLILAAEARGRAADYDLVITANNESDLGSPGVNYIHFPRYHFPRPRVDLNWYNSWSPLLSLYYWTAHVLTGFHRKRMMRNLFLANSAWTAARTRALYPSSRIRVLHPPVHGTMVDPSAAKRDMGFVCVGRISPEKRIDLVIRVLETVRREWSDIHLHIIGTGDDAAYEQRIRDMAAVRKDWVTLEDGLGRTALLELLATHHFGIHGMEEEHFGMGVAEMVRAGMVVFAPDGGGQSEIIGRCRRLLYDGESDAVEKIRAVLKDEGLRRSLASYLAVRAPRFGIERFERELLGVIKECIRG